MQISPIKNQNFEKPSRNPSTRTKVKILKKKNFGISLKKFGSAYAQSPRKCSAIAILAKIEGKEAKFFSKVYEGHIRIRFRSKKNSKLSHACVPFRSRPDTVVSLCERSRSRGEGYVSRADEIFNPIVKGAEWTKLCLCFEGTEAMTTRLYLCFEWNGGMRVGPVYLFFEGNGSRADHRVSLFEANCNPTDQIVSLM